MREKGEEIELPESWRRSWSATYNRPYYWHKRTKQQTWKLPKVENGQECEAPSLYTSPDDLAKQQWPVPAPDSACGTPDAAPASACATPAAAVPDGPDGVMPLTSSNVASLTSMTPQPLAQCGDRGSGSPCDARAVPQRGKGSDHFARLAATAEALGRSRDFGLSAPPDSDFSAPAARADRTPTSWQQPERPGRRNEGSSAAPLFSISFEGVEHHGSSGRDASEQPALGGEPGARTDAEPQAHTRSPRPGGESPEQVLRCSTNDADGPEHGGRKESLEISASCAPTKFAHVNGGTASAEAVAHDERRALRDKELLEFEIEEVHDCPHGDGETAAIHVHTENKRLSADGVTLGAGPVDVQRQRVLQENAQVATGRIRVLPQRHVEETILARQAILEEQGWYASREDTKVPTYRLLPHFRGPDLQRGVGETCGDETGTGRSSHTPFMPPASLAGEELAPRRKHGAKHLMQSAGITFTRSCTNGDTPQASSASNCSLQLVVAKIAPSSAADWSGVIEVGDVLVSVNGHPACQVTLQDDKLVGVEASLVSLVLERDIGLPQPLRYNTTLWFGKQQPAHYSGAVALLLEQYEEECEKAQQLTYETHQLFSEFLGAERTNDIWASEVQDAEAEVAHARARLTQARVAAAKHSCVAAHQGCRDAEVARAQERSNDIWTAQVQDAEAEVEHAHERLTQARAAVQGRRDAQLRDQPLPRPEVASRLLPESRRYVNSTQGLSAAPHKVNDRDKESSRRAKRGPETGAERGGIHNPTCRLSHALAEETATRVPQRVGGRGDVLLSAASGATEGRRDSSTLSHASSDLSACSTRNQKASLPPSKYSIFSKWEGKLSCASEWIKGRVDKITSGDQKSARGASNDGFSMRKNEQQRESCRGMLIAARARLPPPNNHKAQGKRGAKSGGQEAGESLLLVTSNFTISHH